MVLNDTAQQLRSPAEAPEVFSGNSEMAVRMRSFDWERSPLGHPRAWPQSLRTAVDILLNSRYPMFLAWGPELALLYNDGYRPIFGDKHPAALGQPFPKVWAEIWDDLLPLVNHALSGSATWSEDLQLFMERRGFPEEVYFTFSYSPVRADDGAIAGLFCACTETTGKVLGERRLKTLRDLAAATADARNVAEVCRAAADVMASNVADIPFALLYLQDEDAVGVHLAACVGCVAGAAFSPQVIAVRPGEPGAWPIEPVLDHARRILRDLDPALQLPGTPWPEPSTTAAILPLARSGQDALRGYLIVGASRRLPFDDHYERFFDLLAGGVANAFANAEAYEAERKRAEALAEIDRAKTTFFSNVSHEFRTPLTLMLGPLQDLLAADEEHGGLQREPLGLAHRNALRLLKLVNSLLDFSRIEAGRVQASYEPTDLAAFTADLASNFRSACEKAGLALRVDCARLPELAYVDRDMWEKIVLNLLSNAFKFTFEGEIAVSVRAADGRATLRVQDTGVGIPSSELPHLFQRFRRVEDTRGRTHEGSGIGLALVQELVKLHGGRIDVESEAGRGSVFIVQIPLGRNHLPAERIGANRTLAPTVIGAAAFVEEALRWLPEFAHGAANDATVPRDTPAKDAQRALVLLADDNADMRDYLARLLREHWNVLCAADGREALELARRHGPDLVLTDVMMPNLDGFALLRELRANGATADIPVIMLSARAGEEARIEGLESGADEYLVKPFGTRELVARVSSQLALAQGAQERRELLQREQAARQDAELQKRHLTSLFMQAPAPIVILRGPNHVIELVNRHTCEVWRRSYDDVIGKPLLDALPELRGQVFADLLDRVYETGEVLSGRETKAKLVSSADGSVVDVYFNFVYAPLRDIHGNPHGVLVLAFDVTEQVLARDRVDELRLKAEDASRAKDEFIAMLSHELRNPLAPILTALELMRLRADDRFEKERALIERQTRQLMSLVDDLLDVSRIAQGKIELKVGRVEIADVVRNAIEMVSPLLEQRAHYLSVDVAAAELSVAGDAARLAQVVSNLLSNAAKYTEHGGRIAIEARRNGDEIVLSVADNGTGITPDLLPKVFEMFAQARQPIDRSLGGLGLGLSIVRSIVELHGGTVTARSDGPGLGSTFTVRLPAASGAVGAQTVPALRAPRNIATSGGRRVLIVDDNEDAAEMLAEFLAELGHAVHIAHDGPAALRAAAGFAPDVALLDIGLPGMDGCEVAMRLREQPRFANLELLAVTGYAQASERERTQRVGFTAHLVKPIDLRRLATLLERDALSRS